MNKEQKITSLLIINFKQRVNFIFNITIHDNISQYLGMYKGIEVTKIRFHLKKDGNMINSLNPLSCFFPLKYTFFT